MSAIQKAQSNTSPNREPAITRMFDAPRERVFNAWIDPEITKQRSAPRGFTIT